MPFQRNIENLLHVPNKLIIGVWNADKLFSEEKLQKDSCHTVSIKPVWITQPWHLTPAIQNSLRHIASSNKHPSMFGSLCVFFCFNCESDAQIQVISIFLSHTLSWQHFREFSASSYVLYYLYSLRISFAWVILHLCDIYSLIFVEDKYMTSSYYMHYMLGYHRTHLWIKLILVK